MSGTIILNKGLSDETDMCAEWPLKLASQIVVTAPKQKKNLIALAGASGYIDASDVPQGEPIYENRTVSWTMKGPGSDVQFDSIVRQLMLRYHGQRTRISVPWSPDYYFLGRIAIGEYDSSRKGLISFTADVDPYRYKLTESEMVFPSIPLPGGTPLRLDILNFGRRIVPEVTTAQMTAITTAHGAQLIFNRFDREPSYTERNPDLWLEPGDSVVPATTTIYVRVAEASETGLRYLRLNWTEAIL